MDCVQVLLPEGLIARRLESYELRPQQLEMARAVSAAFERGEHLLVEAGTGVGKSFAYLIPAIERATQHQQRVLISTHTIALQEQLVNKDIPFLASVLPDEFTAVLVKGRSNYLGLRRMKRALERQQVLFGAQVQLVELQRIAEWSRHTEDGSLADLPRSPRREVWDLVCSEHGNCMGRRCPEYKRCFYQRARRQAREAQLLIVNHALLFADLAVRRAGAAILPDYDLVVLDEAHRIEDVASEHLGSSLSDGQVRYLLDRLYNDRTRRGFLAFYRAQAAVRAVANARQAGSEFFRELAVWQIEHGRPNGRLIEAPAVGNSASPSLRALASRLKALRTRTGDESERIELNSHIGRAKELALVTEQLLELRQEDWVYWVELSEGRRRQVALHSRPIDVAPILKEWLFDRVSSVVLTSATLNVDPADNFSFARKRLGLQGASGLCLGSPFDYRRQVRIHVETSMPPPGHTGDFIPAACERIANYVKKTDGRAFVLFTAYDMLRQCAERLAEFFASENIELLVQGAGLPRSAMLERFREDVRSVIFGTDTFWGGVDVPGEALSNVIIVKLPFAVPSRPVVEARIEQIRRQGDNPFMEYQLPEAVLKFKQGFGRLIRSSEDRGIVVVLDGRIRTRPYGRRFLDALPPCQVVFEE